MFPALVPGRTPARLLSMDDVLGVSNLYPASGFLSGRGSVQGFVRATSDHTVRTSASLGAATEVYAGTSGSAGLVNGVRLQSKFNSPGFLAVDPLDGTLYVSDSANHTIRKIGPGPIGAWRRWREQGSPGSQNGALQAATFNNPQGIALDSARNLWVADSGNHTIRRINLASGQVATIAGLAGASGTEDGTGSTARFNGPLGIAVEPETLPQQLERFRRGDPAPPVRILVADTGNGRIRRVQENGQVSTLEAAGGNALAIADEKGGANAVSAAAVLSVSSPAGLAADLLGTIYFTEPGAGRVRAILPTGEVVAAIQTNSVTGPKGLFIGEFGRLYASDRGRSAREIAYGRPQITSVTPQPAPGAQVTIAGVNFAPETLVVANGVLALDIQVRNTQTAVRCNSPSRSLPTLAHGKSCRSCWKTRRAMLARCPAPMSWFSVCRLRLVSSRLPIAQLRR